VIASRALVDGQSVDDGEWTASGPIRVFVSGRARVRIFGRARAWASGSARVVVAGEAPLPAGVALADWSSVIADTGMRVVALHHVTCATSGSPSVELYGDSVVVIDPESTLRLRMHGNSSADTPMPFEGRIILHGRSFLDPPPTTAIARQVVTRP
jgi:hypothetical protein